METKRVSNRQYFNCHIAGFTHWEGCLVINDLKPGTKLILERELHNPFDPRAVAIYYGDTKLGYIPKNQNEDISTFWIWATLIYLKFVYNHYLLTSTQNHRLGL